MHPALLEICLLVFAALVLLGGNAESLRAFILRAALVVTLSGAAIVVWALARYWE